MNTRTGTEMPLRKATEGNQRNMQNPSIKASGRKPIEKNYYSEADLSEFRKVILDKLDQAKGEYELLKDTLSQADDNSTDDTAPTFKAMEDGYNVIAKEEIAQLAFRQGKFIRELQNALIRIENKTYGICRVTNKLIPKERLLVVPHATLSVGAKLEQ